MSPEAGQGALGSFQGDEVADGAEQTQDDVVTLRQREVAHVSQEELPGWMLLTRHTEQPRIEVETVDVEPVAGDQAVRMFSGATRDVQDASGLGARGAHQGRDLRRFRGVVLETVDRVVKLRRLCEHFRMVQLWARPFLNHGIDKAVDHQRQQEQPWDRRYRRRAQQRRRILISLAGIHDQRCPDGGENPALSRGARQRAGTSPQK